jgi:hypothetical protein
MKLKKQLVAETGAHGDLVAALGAAAAQHGGAGLGLHTAKKTVGLRAVAAVGLERTLRHGTALLNFSLTATYSRTALHLFFFTGATQVNLWAVATISEYT